MRLGGGGGNPSKNVYGVGTKDLSRWEGLRETSDVTLRIVKT